MLIAEIGNNHFGDFNLAKRLIRMASYSGATAVKFQAIEPSHVTGSMQPEFYQNCAFSEDQYLELMDFSSQTYSMLCFFSVFASPNAFERLKMRQPLLKISGAQSSELLKTPRALEVFDKNNAIISIQKESIDLVPVMKRATLLYVSSYLADDPELNNILSLNHQSKSPVGYSDHTIGIDWAARAVEEHDCTVIEKHFTDRHDKHWGGRIFRDTIHAATPQEFADLAYRMKTKREITQYEIC